MMLMRRQYVLARPATKAEAAGCWGRDYPFRYFAGFDARGRVKTRWDLCRDVFFFYDSPFLARHKAILKERGFVAVEVSINGGPNPEAGP